MPLFKAAVRAAGLKTLNGGRGSISAAESHAKRLDPIAQKRRIRMNQPLAYSLSEELCDKEEYALNYIDSFKFYKTINEVGERANADLAMELKVVVSPEWLKETGSPHDADNPRVQKLIQEAKCWAESWGGDNSVWAYRYDTDERGSGVVDVFMSPIRQQNHKSGKSKIVISCRKAKEELLAEEKKIDPSLKTSGAAMQSSWARWCQTNLDVRIERGTPKIETQKNHIHADIYAKTADNAVQILNDHLFPDPFQPPRPPTPEEEIILKRTQEELEKIKRKATDQARRQANEIRQSAERSAEEIKSRAQQEAIRNARAYLEQRENAYELAIGSMLGFSDYQGIFKFCDEKSISEIIKRLKLDSQNSQNLNNLINTIDPKILNNPDYAQTYLRELLPDYYSIIPKYERPAKYNHSLTKIYSGVKFWEEATREINKLLYSTEIINGFAKWFEDYKNCYDKAYVFDVCFKASFDIYSQINCKYKLAGHISSPLDIHKNNRLKAFLPLFFAVVKCVVETIAVYMKNISETMGRIYRKVEKINEAKENLNDYFDMAPKM